MTTKQITVLAIYATTLALIAWDVYVGNNGTTGDTITEVMRSQARAHPILPFAVGVLIGHLYFS